MSRRRVLYEGRSKIVYEGTEPGTIIQYFKDDMVMMSKPEKRGLAAGKGVLNNRISGHLMTRLEAIGIPTHFMKSVNMREQMVRTLEMIPVQVVMRNLAAGSMVTRLGIKEGTVLPRPVIEFYLKKPDIGNPLLTEDQLVAFNWLDPYELEEIIAMSWRINDYLNGLFAGIGLKLIDFRLEYGRLWGEMGELYLILADEITPDNCRLWDANTGEKLDKDRFRLDLGNVIEGYQQVAERLGLVPKGMIIDDSNFNEQMAASLGEIENDLARERARRSVIKMPTKPRKNQ